MDGSDLRLETVRVGPLPVINAFIARLGLDVILESFVPTDDRRVAVPHAAALGVMLRSVLVARGPIYRQQETVDLFDAGGFGLRADEAAHLGDDRIGRALERLFAADRAALLTSVAIETVRRFGVSTRELHNDATSISFAGRYTFYLAVHASVPANTLTPLPRS